MHEIQIDPIRHANQIDQKQNFKDGNSEIYFKEQDYRELKVNYWEIV